MLYSDMIPLGSKASAIVRDLMRPNCQSDPISAIKILSINLRIPFISSGQAGVKRQPDAIHTLAVDRLRIV
jgi:hypothetical protein